eukprot:COSAG01_NODE_32_length_35644_cov_22.273738_35_plen_211_part_00
MPLWGQLASYSRQSTNDSRLLAHGDHVAGRAQQLDELVPPAVFVTRPRYAAHRDSPSEEEPARFSIQALTDSQRARELTAIVYLNDADAWPSPQGCLASDSTSAHAEADAAPATTTIKPRAVSEKDAGACAGGSLLLYIGTEPADMTGETAAKIVEIEPIGGRLVLFDSRRMLHEVLPHDNGSERLALTVWIGGMHASFEPFKRFMASLG